MESTSCTIGTSAPAEREQGSCLPACDPGTECPNGFQCSDGACIPESAAKPDGAGASAPEGAPHDDDAGTSETPAAAPSAVVVPGVATEPSLDAAAPSSPLRARDTSSPVGTSDSGLASPAAVVDASPTNADSGSMAPGGGADAPTDSGAPASPDTGPSNAPLGMCPAATDGFICIVPACTAGTYHPEYECLLGQCCEP